MSDDRMRDAHDVGVGPFTFDLELARALDYTEDEIRQAVHAMRLLAVGFETVRSLRTGRVCEHCGAAKPRIPHKTCVVCSAGPGETPGARNG